MRSRDWILSTVLCFATGLQAQPPASQAGQRARQLGVPFDGNPGPLNAITDVPHVEIGNTTLISGESAPASSDKPVRTGVTAILPRGKKDSDPVYAGWFSQNGNGEMTGTTWVDESGFLEGPVALTNTLSVGVVRDAIIDWSLKQSWPKHGTAG
jgi:D-aminopeptidase